MFYYRFLLKSIEKKFEVFLKPKLQTDYIFTAPFFSMLHRQNLLKGILLQEDRASPHL